MANEILIVEDDADLAENLAEVLESRGYPTAIAQSAEQALELIRLRTFAGIITDFRLPGLDGIELIEALRKSNATMPVAVVSGFMDDRMAETAQAAGALDVLSKPVRFDRLFELLQAFADSHRQVLVVDDNVPLAENVAEALRERGLDPLIGADAESALATRILPCVAVLDLRLPDRSGVELAQTLRARDPTVQVFFITAYASDFHAPGIEKALPGIDLERACIMKPFDLGELVALVESGMARK